MKKCLYIFNVFLVLALFICRPVWAVSFDAMAVTPLDSAAREMAVGDFNGDGLDDIALLQSGAVSIYQGDGDGSFDLLSEYAVNWRVSVLAVDDFNGDDALDIVVPADGELTILLGNGDGSFVTSSQVDVRLQDPFTLVSGRFNDDLMSDLVITTREGDIYVALGQGNGRFSFSDEVFGIDAEATGSIGGVLAADFNGDALDDIAIIFGDRNSTNIFFSLGSGTLVSAGVFRLGATGRPQVGDVDGDGKADLLTYDGWTSSVSVLLGEDVSPFGRYKELWPGERYGGLFLVDFDGDGVDDIVLVGEEVDEIAVFLSNGDGSFRDQEIIFLPYYRYLSSAADVRVANINADGYFDFITIIGNGRREILSFVNTTNLNQPNLTFPSIERVAVDSVIESESVLLADLEGEAQVKVYGGEYSISSDNGVSWSDWTDVDGVISPYDSIKLRVNSSDRFYMQTNVFVNVGDQWGWFSVMSDLDMEVTPFTFDEIVDVPPNVKKLSSWVRVMGIDSASPISIEGGRYDLITTASSFTSESGVLLSGVRMRLEVFASAEYGGVSEAMVTVGNYSTTFRVTTVHDLTPDEFSIPAKTTDKVGLFVTSEPFSISGISAPTSISITLGQYSLNGGEFTQSEGMVSSSDSIRVRLPGLEDKDDVSTSTVEVGGVSATFSVTYRENDSNSSSSDDGGGSLGHVFLALVLLRLYFSRMWHKNTSRRDWAGPLV